MANVQAQPSPSPLQRGIVKQVISGDSIIMRGQPKGGPPPEKQISLAWISAPKVSKRIPPNADNPKGQLTPEEPYAWEAREFLRKKLIGKEIKFRYEYTVPFGNQKRECGVVFLDEENLVDTLVSEGFVDVIKRKQNIENPEVVRLIELETAAQTAGKGKHSSTVSKRELQYDVEDPKKLLNQTYHGIVEHVINGSTLRVAVEVSKLAYQMITLMLSGIRSPGSGEPYGDEARFYTESRLLQKEVQVRIEQFTGTQNPAFHGSVTIGTNNISEHLVKEGMARCMDRTLLQTLSPEKLRAAEAEAKSKKLRIWKDHKVANNTSTETFDAKVIEIINGDAMMVKTTNDEIKKIFLASVRPPPRPENEKVSRVLYDVPFMFEAREFMRKRLINKKVKVKVDYIQPKKEQFDEKTCCSVFTTDGTNIGEALVLKGLASTVKYRPDDESRSSCYDALLLAEQKAKAAGVGIHGSSGVGQTRVIELSNDLQKAKQFLPFLIRGSNNVRREAVAEFIHSASKIKVYIPKENCCLSLILVGISTPKGNDKYAAEAQTWVKSLIHQREIYITVEAIDKVGNFIGTIFYDDNKNLSVELLKNGYASIRDERGNDYKNAEDEAKTNKLHIWENFKEEEEVKVVDEENGEAEDTPNGDVKKEENRLKVMITQVSSNLTFSAQSVDSGSALEALLTELRDDLNANPPLPGSYHVNKGDVVAAKYSLDGDWYRAKVDKILPQNLAQVTFVDYGNKETIAFKDLAPLPSSKFSVTTFPAVAKDYSLAFVSLPEDPDQIEDIKEVFLQDTADKILLLKVEYKDTTTGLESVTLFDESKKDVVLSLVSDGYFLVNLKDRRKERRLQKTITEYRTAQDAAKKKRLNLWRYGDFTEDDAKEFGFKATA